MLIDGMQNSSYQPVMLAIASNLHVRLSLRKQLQTNRTYFIISVASAKSKTALRAYLSKYPLLTSKCLDYTAWCCADDLIRNNSLGQDIPKISQLKMAMNSQRTLFDWNHLDKF